MEILFIQKSSLGAVGLPVGEFLDVRPLFVVLGPVTYPQESSVPVYIDKVHETNCVHKFRSHKSS